LMRAAQKFNHRRGYRFSTYATPWIIRAIRRSLRENEYQPQISLDETGDGWGSKIAVKPSPGAQDDQFSVELLASLTDCTNQSILMESLKSQLEEMLSVLTSREKQVLTLRFALEHSQGEVGHILGVAISRVSYLEQRAMRKLRAVRMRNDLLENDNRCLSYEMAV